MSAPGGSHELVAVTEDLHYVAPPTVAKADDHYLRGVQSVRNHDYLTALHHFTKATFLAPNEPLPFVARAEAYTHLCDLKSAINSYRKAVALMKDPVTLNDLKARLAQVLDAQGVCVFRDGHVQMALRYAQESLDEHYDASAELRKAVYLIAAHDHERAETILTSSLIQKPEVRVDATVILVELNINLRQDFATAKALLENILEGNGRHPRVLNAEQFFDTAFLAFKQDAEATLDADKLTKCVLAFPQDASLYLSRASAHETHKRYTAAVQDLFSAITTSGGTNLDASRMMNDILKKIADELVAVGDKVSALNYYSEALKWDESCADVLLARGDCYLSLGQHEDALHDYKCVLDADRRHIGALQRLGRLHDIWGSILYNQSKYELAEAEFSKAIQYYDEDPVLFFHRAQCRLMLKEPQYALRDLMSCRELHPTDPEILGLVAQFCTPSSSSGPTGDDAPSLSVPQRSSQPRCRRNSNQHAGRPLDANEMEAMLSAPSVKHSAAMLSQATAARSTQMSALEDKFNPVALREYVKTSTTIAQEGSVTMVVQLNGTHRRASHSGGRPNPHAPSAPAHVWGASALPPLSRLDRIVVTKEAPIPKAYAEHTRERQQRLVGVTAQPAVGTSSNNANHGESPGRRCTSPLDSVLGDVGPGSGARQSYVPTVTPPSQAHRSRLSGNRSAAVLSAATPNQFLFASKASFSSKRTTTVSE